MINRDNMYDQEKEGGSGNGFEMSTNNSDNSIGVKEDPSVKNLQNILFPITPRKSYSAENYLSSNFLKKIQLRENEGENEEPELEGRSSSSYSFIKNRDSKELFTKDISPMDCIDQPPRFPTECQVLDERVKHISYKPCPPEPYYVPTGNEFQPTPIGEESGIVVYQYCPISAVNYFSRSRIGGSEYLLPTCPSPEVDSLLFESRFESGNLAKAIKITPNYYELYLRSDMYTNRHMQWFYFRMTRMKKNYLYRFSIVNMTKSDNLYSEGMRPLIYSERDARLHSIGWRRCGSNITYFPNEKDATEESTDQIQYYTLTFTLEFPHDDDVVYLAHSYPYTYSDLQDYLLEMVSHPVKSTYTTLRLLCKSLAGNNVYYVTVTSPPNQENNGSTSNIKKKKAIVITARVHPGETPASWMMHGFLDYLTSDTAPAKELRDNFIFKLVPMLNPDGVIVGNNRCSLTGKDLNRQYKTVIRETYPSIWYTKLMIRRLIEDCGVAMYCDLHAHSKQHNIFIFGCENKRLIDRKLYEQIFPLMLHKNASEKFSFENCKFKIQKCKEGTGRVVMWMMGIENSFTMEASFGGATLGSRKDTHFNTMDYEQMGKTFCQTLLDYYDEDPRKERLKMKIINRLTKEGSNANEPTNIRLSDFSSDGSDTSSSDGDYERPRIMPLVTPAPPTTPTKLKKYIKLSKPPLKSQTKSPSRKPLEVCKANLLFDINEGESSDDSTQTESGSEKEKKKKKKKKKRKKRIDRKSGAMDFINGGFQIGRDYAVIDIMPDVKYVKSNKKETQPKFILDQTNHVRQNNHQRLLEVQQKLLSLKNKLWFGIGDVDLHRPLSWGPAANNSKSPVKQSKNSEKRISIRRQQKKNNKDEIKERQNKRPKEAMKRQTTVELHPLIKGNGTVVKLRKTKSLSENVKRDTKLIRQSTLKLLNIETSKKDETEPKSGKIKHKKTKPKTAKTTNQSSFNYID